MNDDISLVKVFLDKSEKKKFKSKAAADGTDMSNFIRGCVTAYLSGQLKPEAVQCK